MKSVPASTTANVPLPEHSGHCAREKPGAIPDSELAARELRQREPVFHQPAYGTARDDFEAMTAPGFWEVGASGRVYSRAFVLDTLEARHRTPVIESFEVDDFGCRELAPGLFLATYRLTLNDRRSRRATLWRWCDNGWRVEYHQGTMINED